MIYVRNNYLCLCQQKRDKIRTVNPISKHINHMQMYTFGNKVSFLLVFKTFTKTFSHELPVVSLISFSAHRDNSALCCSPELLCYSVRRCFHPAGAAEFVCFFP